jgi:ankyrin repeat protein
MLSLQNIVHQSQAAIRKMLDVRPDTIRLRDTDTGESLFHCAINERRRTALDILLDAGADPNACDFRLVTPLHLACVLGNEWAVRALLSHGGYPNVRDEMDITPLARLARTAHKVRLRLASILEAAGTVRDSVVGIWMRKQDLLSQERLASEVQYRYFQHLPAEFAGMWRQEASTNTHSSLGKLLGWSDRPFDSVIQAGANVNGPDIYNGPPAIFVAAQTSWLGIPAIDFLIQHGANVGVVYNGQTAIDSAGTEEIRAFMRQAGGL